MSRRFQGTWQIVILAEAKKLQGLIEPGVCKKLQSKRSKNCSWKCETFCCEWMKYLSLGSTQISARELQCGTKGDNVGLFLLAFYQARRKECWTLTHCKKIQLLLKIEIQGLFRCKHKKLNIIDHSRTILHLIVCILCFISGYSLNWFYDR